MMEHGVWASISSGAYRKRVFPFLTRGLLEASRIGGVMRYEDSEDWYPTVVACFLRGEVVWLCARASVACSTEPSAVRSASSKISSLRSGCNDANRASLKSVVSSSASVLSPGPGAGAAGRRAASSGPEGRRRFLDTNASMSSVWRVQCRHRGPCVLSVPV